MSGKSVRAIGYCAIPLAGLAAAAPMSPAQAGAFSVNPVQLSLPDDRQAASLTIRNSDAAPVSIRVQALAWTQVDGTDRYGPTSNLIVSPPIFTIAAGGSQLVRIGVKDRGAASAYRVMLEEIPRQQPVEGQVQVTLRLNLPLYVLPKGGGRSDVSWRAWRDPAGIVIEGRNQGTLHQQVTEIDAEQAGRTILLSKQMGVVLPGSARTWQAESGAQLSPGTPFTLTVRGPSGVTQTGLLLEAR